MAITEEQLDALEKTTTLVRAARMTIEDAIVLMTMARVFTPELTGRLVAVCSEIVEFERESEAEAEAQSPAPEIPGP